MSYSREREDADYKHNYSTVWKLYDFMEDDGRHRLACSYSDLMELRSACRNRDGGNRDFSEWVEEFDAIKESLHAECLSLNRAAPPLSQKRTVESVS